MDSFSDQQLHERWVTNRDAQAFRTMASRHSAMVYHTSRRILQSATEAEDVTQECFLKLAEGHARHAQSIPGWLYTVSIRLSLNRIRSSTRRARRESVYRESFEQPASSNMEDLKGYLDEALSELPEPQRHCLVAHFLEGKTFEQIAEDAGVSRWTVSRRIAGGLKFLRECFSKEGFSVPVTALALILASADTSAVSPSLLKNLGAIALSGERIALAPPMPGISSTAAWRAAWLFKALALTVIVLVVTAISMRVIAPDGSIREKSALELESISERGPTERTGTFHGESSTPVEVDQVEFASVTNTVMPYGGTRETTAVSGTLSTLSHGSVEGARVTINATGLPPLDDNAPGELLEAHSTQYRELLDRQEHFLEAVTNSDGWFRIAGRLPSGMAELRLSAYGYMPIRGDIFLEGGKTTVLELQTCIASLVVGRVELSDGTFAANSVVSYLFGTSTDEPMQILGRKLSARRFNRFAPEFQVRLESLVSPRTSHEPTWIADTSADEDGLFSLWVPIDPDSDPIGNPSQAVLWAYYNPGAYGIYLFVPVNDERTLRFRLSKCDAPVQGVVRSFDGRPVVGHLVQFQLLVGDIAPSSTEEFVSAETNELGEYYLPPLDASQTYLASVISPSGQALMRHLPVTELESGRTNIRDLILQRPMKVRGFVRELSKGRLVAGARVFAKKGAVVVEAQANGAGQFELEVMEGPGEYRFWAQPKVATRRVITESKSNGVVIVLSEGENDDVNLQVPHSWTLSSEIRDATGNLLTGVNAKLFSPDLPDEQGYAALREVRPGIYELSGLPYSERILVTFVKQGYANTNVELNLPEAPSDSKAIEVTLPKCGGVIGRAIDEHGNPIAGILDIGVLGTGWLHQTVADSEGFFELDEALPVARGHIVVQYTPQVESEIGDPVFLSYRSAEIHIESGILVDLSEITLK